jgi:hypothetical protein
MTIVRAGAPVLALAMFRIRYWFERDPLSGFSPGASGLLLRLSESHKVVRSGVEKP